MPTKTFIRDTLLRPFRARPNRAKPRRPSAVGRRIEQLEDRVVPAFTPGDVFVAANNDPRVFNVTAGGNFGSAAAFATLPAGATDYGQFAWTPDLTTAYTTQFQRGFVVALTATGVATDFASNLS